jgi:hypothetical protein
VLTEDDGPCGPTFRLNARSPQIVKLTGNQVRIIRHGPSPGHQSTSAVHPPRRLATADQHLVMNHRDHDGGCLPGELIDVGLGECARLLVRVEDVVPTGAMFFSLPHAIVLGAAVHVPGAPTVRRHDLLRIVQGMAGCDA